MERVILHVDLNCFYASVAVREDPSLRGKPVAVVGEAEQRHGVVLAKTYEAKAYGVKTGQAIWQALQLCPELALCSVDFPKYRQVSRQIQQLYYEYTDQVEPFGTDECWLDVTSSAGLFGSGAEIADQIRGRIRREFGLTASVGVSFNKVFAKLGSDYRKPDATTVFSRENFRRLVWPLPVESLLYVGRATQGKLNRRGIQTIGQLAAAQPAFLRRLLGVNGQLLWEYANGLDRSRVGQYEKQPAPKSIGNSTTAPRDLVCDQDVRIVLHRLAPAAASRLPVPDGAALAAGGGSAELGAPGAPGASDPERGGAAARGLAALPQRAQGPLPQPGSARLRAADRPARTDLLSAGGAADPAARGAGAHARRDPEPVWGGQYPARTGAAGRAAGTHAAGAEPPAARRPFGIDPKGRFF